MICRGRATVGGQLGRPSGARFRTYERLKHYADQSARHVLRLPANSRWRSMRSTAIPLRPTAQDTLNRQLRAGICDEQLAELVSAFATKADSCMIEEEREEQEPQIICSLGLAA